VTGFNYDPNNDPKQWIEGEVVLGQVTKLPLELLQPDRNWKPYCPEQEIQVRNGWDSLACAIFNTLTNIEIIIFRKYGIRENFSDRFIAWATDTHKKNGNDPQIIANFLYDIGAVQEDAWPFSPMIVSKEQYYEEPPKVLFELAKEFKRKYKFNHDILKGGAKELYDSLQYCPVSASVGLSSVNDKGYFYSPNGDYHWTIFVAGKEGEYIEAFDSAEPIWKKVDWASFKPRLMKRYTISKREETETKIEAKQISLMKQLIVLLTKLRDMLLRPGQASPVSPLIAPPRDEKPKDDPTPSSKPNDRCSDVYDAALRCVGLDLSKQADDSVGCAEATSRVLRLVYPNFPIFLSTIELEAYLVKHCKETTTPRKGCISGFKTVGKTRGHYGIWGETHVLSNNSFSGKFDTHYTHATWLAAAKKRKLRNRHFIPPFEFK